MDREYSLFKLFFLTITFSPALPTARFRVIHQTLVNDGEHFFFCLSLEHNNKIISKYRKSDFDNERTPR